MTTSTQSQFCSNCGNQRESGADTFCVHCGAGLQDTDFPLPLLPRGPSPQKAAEARAQRRVVWLCLFVMCYLVLGVFDFLPILPDPLGEWASRAQFFTGLLSFFFWLRWFSAAYALLRFRGDGQRSYRGALLCWFVPLLNLVRPYQVAADLWRRSSSRADSSGQRTSAPIDLIAGWAAWLTFLFLWLFGSNLTARLPFDQGWLVSTIENTRYLAPLVAAAFGCHFAASIDQLQNARDKLLPFLRPIAWLAPVPVGIAAAFMLLTSASGVLSVFVLSPEDSIAKLGDAYNSKDLETFNDYFDAESVLYTTVYQMLKVPQNAAQVERDTRIIPAEAYQDFVVHWLSRIFSIAGPFAAKNMCSLMVTGKPQSSFLKMADACVADPAIAYCGVGHPLVALMDMLRHWGVELGQQFRLSYKGIEKVERSSDTAVVYLRFVTTRRETTIEDSMRVQMRRLRNHWQVTAVVFPTP